MSILVVDDSRTMRRIISSAADMLDCETLVACNGLQALDVLAQSYQDVERIALDSNMPEMDGLEWLERLRADPRYQAIPVLMVTAQSDRAKVAEAIRAGENHYLTKPFSPEDLTVRMMQAMGKGF